MGLMGLYISTFDGWSLSSERVSIKERVKPGRPLHLLPLNQMKKAVSRLIALGILPALLATPVGSVGLAMRGSIPLSYAPAAHRFDQDALAAGALWMLWSYSPEIASHFRHEHTNVAVSLAGLIGMFPAGTGPQSLKDIRRWIKKAKYRGAPRAVSVYTLLDESMLAKDIAQTLDARQIETTLEVDDGLTIAGDASQLTNWVLRPLLWGAIESLHADSPPMIIMRAWREEDMAVISIRDTGRGNPPQRDDQVWTYRLLAGHYGYSAYGLMFAAETVASQGGSMEVDHVPGQGTHIVLRLPVGTLPVAKSPKQIKPGTLKSAARVAVLELVREFFMLHAEPTVAHFHLQDVLEWMNRAGAQWPLAKSAPNVRLSGYLWEWIHGMEELFGPGTGRLFKKQGIPGFYFWAKPLGFTRLEVVQMLTRRIEQAQSPTRHRSHSPRQLAMMGRAA